MSLCAVRDPIRTWGGVLALAQDGSEPRGAGRTVVDAWDRCRPLANDAAGYVGVRRAWGKRGIPRVSKGLPEVIRVVLRRRGVVRRMVVGMMRPIHWRCMCGTHSRCHCLSKSGRRSFRWWARCFPARALLGAAGGANMASGSRAALPRTSYSLASSVMHIASSATRASRLCSARMFWIAVCRSSFGFRGGCRRAALRAVAAADRIACLVRRSASFVEMVSYDIASRRRVTSGL